VDHDRSETVLKAVGERVKGSFDSRSGKGLLDFLPHSATKQTALEYIADEPGVSKPDVVFFGDSGNDTFPLTAGFSGVLVCNADDQLVAGVRQAA
jgi:hydroxymethylpyrimidine pyrophosphatase-like HAD family hydrolase